METSSSLQRHKLLFSDTVDVRRKHSFAKSQLEDILLRLNFVDSSNTLGRSWLVNCELQLRQSGQREPNKYPNWIPSRSYNNQV
jgi:hypothetical protein